MIETSTPDVTCIIIHKPPAMRARVSAIEYAARACQRPVAIKSSFWTP